MSKWEELARKKAEEARELKRKQEEEAREKERKEKEEKKEPQGEEQLEKGENAEQGEAGEREEAATEGNKSEDMSPPLDQSEEIAKEQVVQPQEPTAAVQEPTTAVQEPTTAVQPQPQGIADAKHSNSETMPSTVVTGPAGEEPESAIVTASRKHWQEDKEVTMMEKTFGALATERCLGLLAAVLPHDMTV